LPNQEKGARRKRSNMLLLNMVPNNNYKSWLDFDVVGCICKSTHTNFKFVFIGYMYKKDILLNKELTPTTISTEVSL